MKKITKEDIIIFSIILLIGLIITYPLIIQMHFAPDTYQVVTLGYSEYAKQYFLKSGRIITAGTFFLSDILNIPYKGYVIFMEIIAIISQSLSTMLLYKLFLDKVEIKENIKKYTLLIGCFLIMFNLFALEFLLYAESGILCLSMLFSVIGVITFYKSKKLRYIKTLILILIATILYQGNVNIFFTLAVMFSFIINKKDEKQNWKETIKDIFLAGTILVIAFITAAIMIFLCTNILNVQQERFADSYSNINIVDIIMSFIEISTHILTKSFNFAHEGIYINIIILTVFYIALKEKVNILFKYLFIILVSLATCILPIYTMGDIFISARMCMSIGAIIGISFTYISINIKKTYKIENYIIILLAIVMVLYTGYKYIQISQANIEENKVDNEVGYSIKDMVYEYETNTGNEIKKVAVVNDTNRSFYTSAEIQNTFTERSTANYYCIKEVLEYYLERKITITKMDNSIYEYYFNNKDWNEFSKEQIIFEKDTMYMCIY